METILDIVIDALKDTVLMLPFLFLAYLLIEYLEHHSSQRLEQLLAGSKRLGPVAGAALGCVPQCGFSVAAANLYGGGVITIGTLIAVFLSTSDEAIPVLLAYPGMLGILGRLLVVKFVIALATGFGVDVLLRHRRNKGKSSSLEESNQIANLCRHCGCDHGILLPALRHTIEIFFFLFAVSLVLGGLVEVIGQEHLASILLQGSFFQPFIAALIGFIPSCASSVFLTQMMVEGTLSFGAATAGLLTGAGTGLAVLWRVNRNLKNNLHIMGICYLVAIAAGIVLQLIFH